MKRPMCVIGFPFGAAMCAAFLFDGKTALLLSLAAVLTGALVFFAGKSAGTRPGWLCVAILSAGAAFGAYAAYHYREIAPFERAGGHTITVEGIVTDVKISSRAIDYTVKASFPRVNLPDAEVSLRAYGEVGAAVGDVIRCRAEISRGGAGRSSGAVRAAIKSPIVFISRQGYGFESLRLQIREYFKRNLFSKISGENAAVVGTMVMKTGGEVDSRIYTHMNRSGISHLLAISGLHFSVISAFVLSLLRKIRLPRRVPELLTILFGFFFTVLAGFSPSIIRAFVMFGIVAAGGLFRRQADAVNTLGFAVLLIIAVWPRWTQSVGMWLSALSTLGILLAGQNIAGFLYRILNGKSRRESRILKSIADSAGITAGAYAFTMPLLMIENGWISLIAPITNILSAPLVAPALLGGLLCSIVPSDPLPMRIVASATDFCVSALLRISELLSSLSFAVIAIDEAYILVWLILAAVTAAVLLALRPGRKAAVSCAMLCVISLCAGNISSAAAGSSLTELVTLERCSSAILIKGGEAVLLGAPDKYEVDSVLRYLDYRGINRIGCVFAGNIGDNIDSGIIELAASRETGVIIGPNDAYIAGQTARAVKGVPVYTGGYSTTRVLGGADVSMDINGGLEIRLGDMTIIRTGKNYSPVSVDDGRIYIYNGGEMLLPEQITPVIEPVGAAIYGETRILLRSESRAI